MIDSEILKIKEQIKMWERQKQKHERLAYLHFQIWMNAHIKIVETYSCHCQNGSVVIVK